MDLAWKVLALLSAAVVCQYALSRAVEQLRDNRRRRRRPPSPGGAGRPR
jgi:hypothetical protein